MNQRGFTPLFIILGIALVIGIAGGAYYLGKTQIPKQQSQNPVVNSQTPQPTTISQTTSIPSPTLSDETANWKTYTNTKCKYSIAFPNNYKTLSDFINGAQADSNNLDLFTPDTQFNKLGGWPISGLELRVNCITDLNIIAQEDPETIQKTYPNVVIDKSYVYPALPFPNGLYNWSISGWAYYKPRGADRPYINVDFQRSDSQTGQKINLVQLSCIGILDNCKKLLPEIIKTVKFTQ